MTTEDREEREGDGSATDPIRDAFSILGHDLRLEILLALLADWQAAYTEPKSYAKLMDAVGERDSGKFNYHLDHLRGTYVRQVEEGYVPTASATALYRAVLAHRPTDRLEIESAAVDSSCPACDSTPILEYERGFVTVDCPDCEDWVGFTYPFPQRGVEARDVDELLQAVTRRARCDVTLARRGQCPACAGTTTVDLRVDALDDGEHWIEIDCDDCSLQLGMDLLSAVQTEQRVTVGLERIGVDLDEFDWQMETSEPQLASRDPLRLSVSVEGDAGTATVVTDESLRVTSVEVDS